MKTLILTIIAAGGFASASNQVVIVQNSKNVQVINQNVQIIKQREYPVDNCLDIQWENLGTKRSQKGACQVVESLSLETTPKSYPKMSGMSFNVQYWNALVQRTDTYVTTYRKHVTNVCVRKMLPSSTDTEVSEKTIGFAISNPNLSDKVAHSYELSPLTDSEANEALAAALAECSK